ncbi:ATP-binding protein [Desulfovibrio sp. JC010]|uniref:ATP-binding protein n=1 Tax=Desulfovibrio sp. JC010 TaxID=2593641 RepID=UPI0013D2C8A1|nr:ATP-binding protein [Desulfovibrio sp. JC010]NDV25615.1 PAS domain S-box protein [Desulfovibrio sp. JC010]
MKFRYQILLLALLPLVVSVLISLSEIGQLLTQLKAGIDKDLHASEQKIITRLDAGRQLTAETARVIAESDDILLGLQTTDVEMLYQQGRMFLGSDVDYIAFIDPHGMINARGHDEFRFGDTPETNAEIHKGLAGKEFSGLTKYDGQTLLFSVAPIHYYDGTTMGAVVVGITIKSDFLKSIAGVQGVRVQINKNKKILADSMPGKSTLEMRSMTFPYPAGSPDPYTVKVMFDASERLHNLSQLQNNLGIYGSILAAVLISLIFFFTNRLVDPIKTLVVAMHDYTSKGVTSFNIPRSTKEIYELVNAFREMICDLEENKKSLVDAEKKYRTIFEKALQGIYQTDLDGKIIVANPAIARIYGAENTDELTGTRPGSHAFKYSSPESHELFLREIVEKGENKSQSFSLINSAGQEKLIIESGQLLYDEEGKPFAIEGAVRDETRKMQQEKTERKRSIAEAASKAKSVFLDNSGQGFLSFGPELLVDGEFSRECANILPDMCAGCEISKLLYPDPDDDKIRKQFAFNLQRILKEEQEFKRDLFISLMPQEFNLIRKIVKCDYKYIEGQLMMILTDITAERKLEETAKQEQKRLRFIVSTVRSSKDFFDITESFNDFCAETFGPALKSGPESPEQLEELYRGVHTFKGLMLQQDFIHTPPMLHELETLLGNAAQEPSSGNASMQQLFSACKQAFDKDMEIIRESLGEKFLKAGPAVSLSRETAEELKNMAADMLAEAQAPNHSDETRKALLELTRIDHLSIIEALENGGRVVDRLAPALEKEVDAFTVEGDDIYLDAEKFGPFLQSLVHVFRNAIDHGIETPDERLELEKEGPARISCSVHTAGGNIEIIIADNGRGIDADLIREAAVAKGMMNEEEAVAMTDEEIQGLIFKTMFSTREKVTSLSGRGVGLGAVSTEVEALGGTVRVESELWKGTKFIFNLPLETID